MLTHLILTATSQSKYSVIILVLQKENLRQREVKEIDPNLTFEKLHKWYCSPGLEPKQFTARVYAPRH